MFNILSKSNINGISSIYNILLIIAVFINVLFLIINRAFKNYLFPILITVIYLLFLLFNIKIVPLSAIFLLLTCYNSNLLEIKDFVKYTFLTILISFLSIVLLNFLGKIPSIASTLQGVDKGNSLGFAHPNITGDIVIGLIISLFIFFNYIVNAHKLLKLKKFCSYIIAIILSLIIAIPLYKITNCKSIIYFEIVLIILIIFGITSISRKFVYKIIIPLLIGIPLLFIYFDYEYNSSNYFYNKIDTIFSKRIGMQNIILQDYPIHFIQYSKDIPNISQLDSGTLHLENENYSFITIDNSFVSILEMCGIIGLIISGYIIVKAMLRGINIHNYIACVLILEWVIYNCVSSDLFSLYLITPIIYIYILLNNKYRRKGVNE